MIRDGVEGLLVPPANPEALAAALIRVLNDPELQVHLGRSARARIQELTSVRMTDALVTVYREALGDVAGVQGGVPGVDIGEDLRGAAAHGSSLRRVSRGRPHPAP